ncbi:hypothetical protein OBV_19000 [Oscillibacter valericigenes Sjm18-20]|nr:hypothetical protein OBV_19000 [Oscillibacter valericigenes Sjm18-20]
MEQEWSGRITALEERVSSNIRRIGALEQGQETLRRLATAVEVLATKQETMADSVAKLDEKMDALEQRPRKRWESLVDKILLVLAGAFVSFLLTQGGGA